MFDDSQNAQQPALQQDNAFPGVDSPAPAAQDEPTTDTPTDTTDMDNVADDVGSDQTDNNNLPDTPAEEPVHDQPQDKVKHADTPSATAPEGTEDLVEIKKEALGYLSPLLGHLDQPAEERFRTMMMMIQASDDQSLVKSAYEAALQIADEKARAQALLDVVNEINYFTQQGAQPENSETSQN